MRSPNLFFVNGLFACCALAAMHGNIASPFGLSFSPTTITASRIDSTGSIELIKYPVNPGYKAYYHDAIHAKGLSAPENDDPQLQADRRSMFHHLITPFINSLTKQLGHEPEFASIFLPSVFHSRVKSDAIHAIYSDISDRAIKAGPAPQAICHGYGFFQGKHIRRSVDECNGNGPESFIFVLEYEEEYLYAWLMETDFEQEMHLERHEKLGIDCGEKHRQAIGEQAYEDRITVFLDDFINNIVLQEHRREDIRAIVISGEASAIGNARLGTIAQKVVASEEAKLITDINPSEVVAHGAAAWAQFAQQHPDFHKVHDGNLVADEQYYIEHEAARKRHGLPLGHDEL